MTQTHNDRVTSKAKHNFSSHLVKSRSTTFITNQTINKHHASNYDIEWKLTKQQFEAKLQNSPENILLSSSAENTHSNNPLSTISNSLKCHPTMYNERTVIEQPTQHDDLLTLYSLSSNEEKSMVNEIVTNRYTSSKTIDQTSLLSKLYTELSICQQKQAYLLEQIEHTLKQSTRKTSSLAFFLPLNNNHNHLSSLQDAFQQRKTSFIQHSKERINQIYRHNHKHHHITPNIKPTNNTYLKQKRQYEYNRLCTMMTKHQNRQNAKTYGNLIKKSIVH